jgi:sulfite reductase beta subunit-like hemoprotein
VTQARVSGDLARRAGKAEHPMLKDIGVVGKRQGGIDVLLDDDQSRGRLGGMFRRSLAPAPSDGVVDMAFSLQPRL